MKKQYWFTVSSADHDCHLNILDLLKDQFNIIEQQRGSGLYNRMESDFYVKSAQKRKKIKQFIKINIKCGWFSKSLRIQW